MDTNSPILVFIGTGKGQLCFCSRKALFEAYFSLCAGNTAALSHL